MAFKFSTGLRNAVLGTDSARATLEGGVINIYSDAVPATADAALGGATLLVTISNDGGGGGLNFDAIAADGLLVKDPGQIWKGEIAAGGTATFFRWVMDGDTGGVSDSEVRIQGAVGMAGTDMVLSNTALTATEDQILDSFVLAFPAG